MKKITHKQFKDLKGIKAGRVQHEIPKQLEALNVNEGLYIEKAEWTFKTPPNIFAHVLKYRTGHFYSVKTIPNGDISILRIK